MSQADAVSTIRCRRGSPKRRSHGRSRASPRRSAPTGCSPPTDLREFRDPFQHATWDTNTASAVVMPTTVEEIQEILRVANEHGVPLWTHGTGRNNGYGGPAPRVTAR